MMFAFGPKILRWILGGFLGMSLWSLVLGGEPQIQWSDDIVATMAQAQQTGKPVLVHFYGDHCPPCRMLEKKAFKDRQLIQAIESNLLAVKINAEKETKIAAKFRVNRWPTDIYLYPNGQEIYRNISSQDPAAYEKTVLKVAEKNQKMIAQLRTNRTQATRSELLAAQSDSATTKLKTRADLASARSIVANESDVKSSQALGGVRVRLSEGLLQGVDTSDVAVEKNLPEISDHQTVNQQAQAKVVEAPVPELATSPENLTTADQVVAQTADPVLPSDTAMGGYCPVSLSVAIHASQAGQTAASAWVRGNPEYAVRHRGRVYHCASQELLTKFLEKPDLYAPVLSGCDLVEYSKSGKWIDGDCRFGFIDKETGRIFLFSSSLNCQEFAQNCESYSSMVGKPSEH